MSEPSNSVVDPQDPETFERLRQAIMRYAELLRLMRSQLQEGEQAYSALMATLNVDATLGIKEKQLQWQLAEAMIEDVSPLSRATFQMRVNARNLEHDFAALYDVLAALQHAE